MERWIMCTDCGGGIGGVERVEDAPRLESAFGRRIAFFVSSQIANARRRKDLPDSSVCFQRSNSIWISDPRAIDFAGSFPKIGR